MEPKEKQKVIVYIDGFNFWWCFKKYDTTLNVPIIDIKES